MTSTRNCPVCGSVKTSRSAHGGLFTDRCLTCGAESSGTCNPTVDNPGSSSAFQLRVRWVNHRISSHALRVLRDLSPAAKEMSLTELSNTIAGGTPFDLGVIQEYKRMDVVRLLTDAGFTVDQEAVP